jgi:hypothetical protein
MIRSPDPDEAAAIVAAVQRFVAETAPAREGGGETIAPWQRAALVEGVGARATVQEHREGGGRWLS